MTEITEIPLWEHCFFRDLIPDEIIIRRKDLGQKPKVAYDPILDEEKKRNRGAYLSPDAIVVVQHTKTGLHVDMKVHSHDWGAEFYNRHIVPALEILAEMVMFKEGTGIQEQGCRFRQLTQVVLPHPDQVPLNPAVVAGPAWNSNLGA